MINHDLQDNPLYRFFASDGHRLIHKWIHYFAVYHHHLGHLAGKDIVFLEFGVSQGGSLQMWKNYFGPGATIIGVNIDPRCKSLEESRIKVRIGDQEGRLFLRELVEEFKSFDAVLDDGGHTMPQQIHTFEEIFPHVAPNGVYITEDMLTSYRLGYQGGLQKRGTFVEYAKRLVDQLHAWHSQEPDFAVDAFTRSVHGMHFYDSILVLEKRAMSQPRHEKRGAPSF